jgi:hypothetical protein
MAFKLVGVPAHVALSASILYSLCILVANLLGGVVAHRTPSRDVCGRRSHPDVIRGW